MPFIRRKRGQVLLVHTQRSPEGRVVQETLFAFPAPAELQAVLQQDRWLSWRGQLARRHPDLRWNWPRIRQRLAEELARWSSQPSGGAKRRLDRIKRLAGELERALAEVSRAAPSEARLLQEADDTLRSLRRSLDRLLEPAGQEEPVSTACPAADVGNMADMACRAALEHWKRGELDAARGQLQRGLAIDRRHPLALVLRGRLAYEGGSTRQPWSC